MSEWEGGVQKESPAIAELKSAIREVFPDIVLGTVRDDGSRHTAGVAMDIMLDSTVPSEKMMADSIIEGLIDTHSLMGWGNVLYTDWFDGDPVWFSIPGAPPYGGAHLEKNEHHNAKLGKAHEDHVHIDWWTGDKKTVPPGAKKTGFKAKLANNIQQALSSRRPYRAADYSCTRR